MFAKHKINAVDVILSYLLASARLTWNTRSMMQTSIP